MSLPEDPRLRAVAESVAPTLWAAEIWDSDWRLAWVSDELKAIMSCDDEERLGYGRELLEVRFREPWLSSVEQATRDQLIENEAPYIAWDIGADHANELLRAGAGPSAPTVEAVKPPLVYSLMVRLVQPGQPTMPVQGTAMRLYDSDEFVGTLFLYGSTLPARLLAYVTRGNQAMFERMAELVEPGRRTAAVLFADLQASGSLSRRLPSAAYFDLVKELTTEMDRVVIRHKGIVGKHAGDGVTAFFLADQFESASAAAAAAIESAHEIRARACSVSDDLGARTGLYDSTDCAINIGLHWGGTLYMGQVVTGGRLEVTALGDEVNEGARIQQSARGGTVLASKALIERLGADDGRRIGVDPEDVVYTSLADVPGADMKAVRDAGTLPVTELYADEREPAVATA
jgi:class 3 adenylate cyclase